VAAAAVALRPDNLAPPPSLRLGYHRNFAFAFVAFAFVAFAFIFVFAVILLKRF
jgi:hypothetical protein